MAKSNVKKILKLVAGLCGLSTFFAIIAYGFCPKGTIERNVREEIDATPIFYSAVEKMPSLEKGYQELLKIGDGK